MEVLFLIFLFIFGSLFGSLASVIIYRLKKQEKGIVFGRSTCASCKKTLHAKDLIPIISWLWNKGKCRYCNTKVSPLYPILEISMGALFVGIGYFLGNITSILAGDIISITSLLFWLFIGFITITYTFYDILFLEIHDLIMGLGIIVALIFLVIQTLTGNMVIAPHLGTAVPLSIGIISIILSISIIGVLYIIMLKELKEIWDCILLIICIGLLIVFGYYSDVPFRNIPIISGSIGALGIFIFFFLQILISKGQWLGGGDLRIGIFIGLILGIPFSFAGVMITYCLGSILGIFYIIGTKIKHGWKYQPNTQIPFGPLLALGFFLCIFYNTEVIKLIEIYLGNM